MRTQPLNFEEFTWTVFLSESETRIYELKALMASSYKQEGHQFVQKYFEIVTITRDLLICKYTIILSMH